MGRLVGTGRDLTNATIPRPLADLGRRFGYALASAINAVLYVIVSNVIEWEWPGFLTADFDRADEVVLLSLGAAVVANLIYVWNDTMPLKAFMEATVSSISLVATIRIWQVFPFDFSENSFDWTTVARVVLGIAIVGTAIAIITNLVKGIRAVVTEP